LRPAAHTYRSLTPLGAALAVNPYEKFALTPDQVIWPRGFPLDLVKGPPGIVGTLKREPRRSVSVVQFLQDENADFDAIFRLTHTIPKEFSQTAKMCYAIDAFAFAPANAQSTLFAADAFEGLLMPMSVNGRVADIWRSYIFQFLNRGPDRRLAFCPSIVKHVRNPHDLTGDFNAELPLYQMAGALLEYINEAALDTRSRLDRLKDIYVRLYEAEILDITDVELVDRWIYDLREIGKRVGIRFE
jgi:hypothetical protein